MTLIVVEGPDGSGKTTLINNLRSATKRYYWTARSSGAPPTQYHLLQAIKLLQTLSLSLLPVILDRHVLISDPIYGPLLRDENPVLDVYTERGVKNILLNTVKRIIYCCPPRALVIEGAKIENQLKGVPERIERLIDLYDLRMTELQEYGIEVIWYNRMPPAAAWDIDELFFGGI